MWAPSSTEMRDALILAVTSFSLALSAFRDALLWDSDARNTTRYDEGGYVYVSSEAEEEPERCFTERVTLNFAGCLFGWTVSSHLNQAEVLITFPFIQGLMWEKRTAGMPWNPSALFPRLLFSSIPSPLLLSLPFQTLSPGSLSPKST